MKFANKAHKIKPSIP